jgi:peroxiredoxin
MGGGLCKTQTTAVSTSPHPPSSIPNTPPAQEPPVSTPPSQPPQVPPPEMSTDSEVKPGHTWEGKKLPNVVFRTRVRDDSIQPNPFKWKDVTTDDLFKGKKVVLLALPGAFTPTCSSTHLPGYDQHYEDFKKLGIDEVICLSVNDAFVMFQWAKHLNVKSPIFMLPDGNGDFTKGVGMLVKKSNLGFGLRSWRYSMYVEDGVCKKHFMEDGFADDHPEDPFAVSDAETMLNYLKSKQ